MKRILTALLILISLNSTADDHKLFVNMGLSFNAPSFGLDYVYKAFIVGYSAGGSGEAPEAYRYKVDLSDSYLNRERSFTNNSSFKIGMDAIYLMDVENTHLFISAVFNKKESTKYRESDVKYFYKIIGEEVFNNTSIDVEYSQPFELGSKFNWKVGVGSSGNANIGIGMSF